MITRKRSGGNESWKRIGYLSFGMWPSAVWFLLEASSFYIFHWIFICSLVYLRFFVKEKIEIVSSCSSSLSWSSSAFTIITGGWQQFWIMTVIFSSDELYHAIRFNVFKKALWACQSPKGPPMPNVIKLRWQKKDLYTRNGIGVFFTAKNAWYKRQNVRLLSLLDYSVAPEAPVRQTWKQCSESRAAPKSCLSVLLGVLAFTSRPCRYWRCWQPWRNCKDVACF